MKVSACLFHADHEGWHIRSRQSGDPNVGLLHVANRASHSSLPELLMSSSSQRTNTVLDYTRAAATLPTVPAERPNHRSQPAEQDQQRHLHGPPWTSWRARSSPTTRAPSSEDPRAVGQARPGGGGGSSSVHQARGPGVDERQGPGQRPSGCGDFPQLEAETGGGERGGGGTRAGGSAGRDFDRLHARRRTSTAHQPRAPEEIAGGGPDPAEPVHSGERGILAQVMFSAPPCGSLSERSPSIGDGGQQVIRVGPSAALRAIPSVIRPGILPACVTGRMKQAALPKCRRLGGTEASLEMLC